jgi:uncharacterized membrane protein
MLLRQFEVNCSRSLLSAVINTVPVPHDIRGAVWFMPRPIFALALLAAVGRNIPGAATTAGYLSAHSNTLIM